MSDEHPVIDDPTLGSFTRAVTALSDGSSITHDWYSQTHDSDGSPVELLLEGSSADDARRRLPRLNAVVADLGRIARLGSDAIVAAFSQGDPEPHELEEAASDLTLDTVTAESDGVVLHFSDSCGTHFPDGYWPAVHLADDDTVSHVTVES